MIMSTRHVAAELCSLCLFLIHRETVLTTLSLTHNVLDLQLAELERSLKASRCMKEQRCKEMKEQEN